MAAVLSMTTRRLPGTAGNAHCAPLGDGDSDGWLSRGTVLQVDASTRSCRNTTSILLKQALDARAHIQEGRGNPNVTTDTTPPVHISSSLTGIKLSIVAVNVTEITIIVDIL